METKVYSIRNDFRERVDKALAGMKKLEEFRKSDVMVEYVLNVGSKLFTVPLDKHNPGELVRIGGKLTGAYGYLAQLWGYSRAQRDVYRQKLDEMTNELSLRYYKETSKITHARAQAKSELNELAAMVILKEAEVHNFEHIVLACEKMIGFIQSAIKVKEGERFTSQSGKLSV